MLYSYSSKYVQYVYTTVKHWILNTASKQTITIDVTSSVEH